MKPYRPDLRIFFGLIIALTIAEISVVDLVFGISPQAMLLKSGAIASFNGFLWLLFDNHIWKWPIARMMGLSHVPDLNGTWVGELKRSGEADLHGFSMTITQTFSKISIQTKSMNSSSHCLTASIITDDFKRNFKIISYWQSRTKDKSTDHMADFHGLSNISVDQTSKEIFLSDYYFTNRKPTTTEGTIKLRRRTL